MRIDGKQIAGEIISSLSQQRGAFGVLKLGVLMGEGDAASASFVKIKERVADRLHVVVVQELVNEASRTSDAVRALERLSRAAQGVIVQLPLPPQLSTEEILKALPPEKDLDAVSTAATRSFVRAPVAAAVEEILSRSGIAAAGKKAVVVGAGRLVGIPCAELLTDLGAQVSIITTEQGSLEELKNADIIVLGAGNPGMVRPQMLKKGVVLIDAGTSEAGGKVQGDADPACEEVAFIFTPVPGGIGPIAVAMIFKNLFTLAGMPGSQKGVV